MAATLKVLGISKVGVIITHSSTAYSYAGPAMPTKKAAMETRAKE